MTKIAVTKLTRKNSNVKTKSFWKSVCESVLGADLPEKCGFVPDAFEIDKSKREIRIYEITGRLSEWRIEKMALAWFYLDCEGWKLRLFGADRYGNNLYEIQLIDWYFELFGHEVQKAEEMDENLEILAACARCGKPMIDDGYNICKDCDREIALERKAEFEEIDFGKPSENSSESRTRRGV